MRIISGIAKGKKIKCRKGIATRPTMDRVKEALFSIIKPYIKDSIVLDLFSGTGNLALEAISQGAERAIMIERDKEALRVIIENINNLGFEDRCRAYHNDVFKAIKILEKKLEKFDLIFLDPPYIQNLSTKVITEIEKLKLLSDDGLIICEHHKYEDLPDAIGVYKKINERSYGKKTLTFYSH